MTISSSEIPLHLLRAGPESIRDTPATQDAHAELKASIRAIGLLEGLVVRSDKHPEYAVVAGGRRLAVLQELAAEGIFPPNMPIPCQIVAVEQAREAALAENVVRVAMHPADQVKRFADLFAEGASVPDIAARFGISERVVHQRIRLAGIHLTIIDAYRAGELSLDTLSGFAVTTDQNAQLAAWIEIKRMWNPSRLNVLHVLTEGDVRADSALGRYVGLDAYEAAGGDVRRDLFADDDRGVWMCDRSLVRKLALNKLDATAERLRADGWKWVETHLEPTWEVLAPFSRLDPEGESSPTADEASRQREIDARLREIEEMQAVEEVPEAIEDEYDELEEERLTLHATISNRSFTDEQKAVAGCIVSPDQIYRGLVRREDKREARVPSTPQSPETYRAERKADLDDVGIRGNHADELKHLRIALVRADLARDFTAAFDLFTFESACWCLGAMGWRSSALEGDLKRAPDTPEHRRGDSSFSEANPGQAIFEAQLASLPREWYESSDVESERWEAFVTLSPSQKQRWFAYAVARSLKPQLAFESHALPQVEDVIRTLEPDFAGTIRPTVENFWGKLPKAKCLEIAKETLGGPWAAAHETMKKKELAETLERVFGDGMTEFSGEARDNLEGFTLPGFLPED